MSFCSWGYIEGKKWAAVAAFHGHVPPGWPSSACRIICEDARSGWSHGGQPVELLWGELLTGDGGWGDIHILNQPGFQRVLQSPKCQWFIICIFIHRYELMEGSWAETTSVTTVCKWSSQWKACTMVETRYCSTIHWMAVNVFLMPSSVLSHSCFLSQNLLLKFLLPRLLVQRWYQPSIFWKASISLRTITKKIKHTSRLQRCWLQNSIIILQCTFILWPGWNKSIPA